ncbi:MAG: DNA polymerase IV [Lentisphaerae bacterium]|nr:DNA polymerase IV [Lentisphaerota bacterium]
MTDRPFMLHSYPRAILHLDGDAFFTSVEQALVPALRGRPVVTGRERGIIACASYEAKARGVRRGLPLFEARKLCPELVILPSDYESYSLYSKRMFDIMRRYTPVVEEYSIDEGFADLTGLRRLFRCSYETLARRIADAVRRELGISVSAGLSLTKSLAKLCSDFRKPAGFTAVPGRYIHLLLRKLPLDAVWGFGPNTVSLLRKQGLRTAYDFAVRPEAWARNLLKKPGHDIWNELRGNVIWSVETAEPAPRATIIKSKTFTPPSRDRAFVYARLVRNVESAFIKARRFALRPRALGVVLRRQDFGHEGLEAALNRPTASTLDALPLVHALFDRVFREGVDYRATMVVLGALEPDGAEQLELFEDRLRIDAVRRATHAVDAVNRQYGKHALRSAATLFMDRRADDRRAPSPRWARPLPGENTRRHLALPRSAIRV